MAGARRAVAPVTATLAHGEADLAARPGALRLARFVVRRWPSALGLALAAVVVALGRHDAGVPVTVLGIAVLCYLGAAATGRRWVAWAGVPGGVTVVAAAQQVPVPWWLVLLAAGVLLTTLGMIDDVPRRAVVVQALAAAGFAGLGMLALAQPTNGLLLAGLALASHGLWDVIHHRNDAVVPRSLAECCVALDLSAGLVLAAAAMLDTLA